MNFDLPRILPQGTTRSRVTSRYALITRDSHVPSSLPNWTNTRGIIQISPRIGAQFLQYEAHVTVESTGLPPPPGVQRFVYVIEGSLTVKAGTTNRTLATGGFAYFPAGQDHQLTSTIGAQLFVLEKTFIPLDKTSAPELIIGTEAAIQSNPFLGDEALQLKLLLPDIPAFDMAVNIFTYATGGTLPQVEIHVMEHGLLMLQGAGVYRLAGDWHPVEAGDIIWMAPYCEQWFVAMGKHSARYIYYKDVNRHPGTGR